MSGGDHYASLGIAYHCFGSASSAARGEKDSVADITACLSYGTILPIILLVSGCRWEKLQVSVVYIPASRNQTTAVTWFSYWSSSSLPRCVLSFFPVKLL